jgi:hypothetical protein
LLGVVRGFKESPECLEKEVTPRRHNEVCAFSFICLFENFVHVHMLDIPRET